MVAPLMETSFDVPDPSDWLNTPVSKLASVETALRCQVCKDLFSNPVITSCSHTFCSLCIRRCLTNDGKCPACRAVDQELRLRPNWIVKELVDAFQSAREEILQLGKDVMALRDSGRQGNKKRKLELSDTDEEAVTSPSSGRGRKTRSQNNVRSPLSSETERHLRNDNLIACPICSQRMKEEDVFAHLDVHNGSPGFGETEAKDANASKASTSSLGTGSRSRPQSNVYIERLPQLNYSLMNDNALRKKLSGLGIPSNGPRDLLARRHTEWVNLVNSNCDSRTPKGKRELLRELDVWEKSQGRQTLIHGISGPSVMDKDFDGAEWASRHNGDFQKLISAAKRKAKSQKGVEDEVEARTDNLEIAKLEVDNETVEEMRDIHQSSPGLHSSVWNSEARCDSARSETDAPVGLDAGG